MRAFYIEDSVFHFLSFVIFLCYIIKVIRSLRTGKKKNPTTTKITDYFNEKRFQIYQYHQSKPVDYYKSISNFLSHLEPILIYFSAFFTIYGSMNRVSILNIGLFLVTLYMIFVNKNKKSAMTIYMIYLVFLMIVRYVAYIVPEEFPTLNIEYLSIMGIYSGNKDEYKSSMVCFFIALFLASSNYFDLLKEHNNLIKTLILFQSIYSLISNFYTR